MLCTLVAKNGAVLIAKNCALLFPDYIGEEGVSSFKEAVFNQYWNSPGEVEAVVVKERIEFTPEQRASIMFQEIKGAVQLYKNGDAIISALSNPNATTPMHEIANVYEQYLNKTERKAIESWL